jgi:hypothetical protein
MGCGNVFLIVEVNMAEKLTKKMFEPLDGVVTLKKGNGRRVSYMSVKRYADTLKEIALKRRISIAAVLSEACQQPIVAKRPAARMNPKRAKA